MSIGKIIKKILIVIIVLMLGISAFFYIQLQKFSKEIKNIEINNVNMSKINDGVYTGKYYANDTVGAKVKVTVKNKKITNIDFIEHKYGKGKKAEVITSSVVEKQSLNVDTISGATGSSKVILKAIENALSIGLSK